MRSSASLLLRNSLTRPVRPPPRHTKLVGAAISPCRRRPFSHAPPRRSATESRRIRIYPTPVRTASDLDTLLLGTTSSSTILLAFFSASWCPTCRTTLPRLTDALSSPDLLARPPSPLASGGSSGDAPVLSFAEIEIDAPGNEELGGRYAVTSLPTLMAFNARGEARMETRVTDGRKMSDRAWIRAWIETEVREGQKMAAGSLLKGWFGGG